MTGLRSSLGLIFLMTAARVFGGTTARFLAFFPPRSAPLWANNFHLSGNATNSRELEAPPIASSNSQAVEVLRVWAAPGQPQQLTLRTTWKDAGAGGLLLADVARHAANAYANEGQNKAEVLRKIRRLMDAEFSRPTDNPIEIK